MEHVRTRTIFSGDIVRTTLLRATTLPLFKGAVGRPLDAERGLSLVDKLHSFEVVGWLDFFVGNSRSTVLHMFSKICGMKI